MGGGTNIAEALRHTHASYFSKAKGARDDAKRIVVLITDGVSMNTDQVAKVYS